jgi:hypothetical protein
MTADLDSVDSQWRTVGRVAIVVLAAVVGGWVAIYLWFLFWATRLSAAALFYALRDLTPALFVIAPASAALCAYVAATLIKRNAVLGWADSPIASRLVTVFGMCLLAAGIFELYFSTFPIIATSAALLGLPGLAVALATKSYVHEPTA